MDLQEAIKARHSVRAYIDKPIEGEVLEQLQQTIAECNQESGLNIQLCLNEPQAFSGRMAHYGKFKNARNYIALVGKKADALAEKCGYYGEKIVLKATQLGLHSCWVALSYSKNKTAAVVNEGEKLALVISLGYGETSGVSHKVKRLEALCRVKGEMPAWFRSGLEAVQLAPTALNQQRFRFELQGDAVKAVALLAPYSKVDLGIVKYHFELGAGNAGWHWA